MTRNQMAIDRRKQLIRDYSRESEIGPAERSTLTETLTAWMCEIKQNYRWKAAKLNMDF